MLGKLLKYEFRATGRLFLPLYGALVIFALINVQTDRFYCMVDCQHRDHAVYNFYYDVQCQSVPRNSRALEYRDG